MRWSFLPVLVLPPFVPAAFGLRGAGSATSSRAAMALTTAPKEAIASSLRDAVGVYLARLTAFLAVERRAVMSVVDLGVFAFAMWQGCLSLSDVAEATTKIRPPIRENQIWRLRIFLRLPCA